MGEEAAASSNQFSSNSARYAQRAATAETLRATQEELATKIRELQIYEANYMGLKKDLARWKKKFEYVFRENELLALETGKLDASHKQIAFLQQEIKFKEEEGTALRGLVSALEAANKKQRATRLDSAARGSGLRGSEVAAAVAAAERKSNEDAEAALAEARQTHAEEKTRLSHEVAALKAENALLLKDVDRKELALQRQEEQVSAHKGRISGLEQALRAEQDSSMARLREKQDRVADLELQLQQMQLRRRSSVAAALARAEEEGQDMVGFGAVERLRLPRTESVQEGDEQAEDGDVASDEEPDTPPGTPPPISAGGLLPPEDPTADQTVRDWMDDRKIRAARSLDEALDLQRVDDFVEKLPYEAKDGVRRLLRDALAGDGPEAEHAAAESQILLRAVSSERQRELQEFLVPLLKAHHGLRVTYATMQRRTLVTDVRVTLERRRHSVTGGLAPGEKRFGKDHAFLGPSSDDVAKLVPHAARELSTANKAVYVSKPQHVEPPPASPATDERSSDQTQEPESPADGHETVGAGGAGAGGEAAPAANRMWRGMSAAKFIGTMAAGAKLRVAATFKNAKYAHEGTSCQFCKMAPIVGPRFSCATCVGFDLCETCYSLGGHGLENSDELFFRVQELVLARCVRLQDEMDLLELMRYEICRSNLRKFSFCLNWLADIVNGKTSRELQARALEIPSIRRDVRKQFVPLLMRVCSDREDIEVKTEWELEDDDAAAVRTVVRGSLSEGDNGFIETLRIWVADQYRTTSPFVERSLLKFREGEEGEEDASDDDDADADADADARDADARAETEGASSQPGFLERNRIQSQQF